MSRQTDGPFIPSSYNSPTNSDSSELIKPSPKRKGRPPIVPQSSTNTSKPSSMFNSTNTPRNVLAAMESPQTRRIAAGRLRREDVRLQRPVGQLQDSEGSPRKEAGSQPAESRARAEVPAKRNESPNNPSLGSKKKNHSKCFSKPGSEFVQIHIGEESQVFSIHLDVISHDSSYFRDAFSRQHGIEGQTKIMILKDIEVKVFGMFNQWLYTKVIECDGTEPDLMDLAKLWSCASVWRVSQLQNDAMKLLIPLVSAQVEGPAAGRNNILQQFIDHAYSTKEYSVLKKLAVHKMMSFIPTVRNVKMWLEAFPHDMQTDFTCEVVKNVSRLPKNLQFPQLKQSAIYDVTVKTEVDLTE
ncbi:hypothetical protein BKA61DRAFT_731345 [Leptodontidium sp. MPI-SDFR-AT-0119]|nr:hypothetical protein BKA61DRAFT_731345 [Leptodontidium sp. MPI-SDFR-AT-0119]